MKKSLIYGASALALLTLGSTVVSSVNVNASHAYRSKIMRQYKVANPKSFKFYMKHARANRMIRYGRKYLGSKYNEADHAIGAHAIASGKNRSRHVKADNSGFIWGVMRHNGYKVTKEPWTVGRNGSANKFFKAHHETVKARHARRGSIVITNKNPHVAIMLQRWHGPKTKVLNDGGDKNDVNVSTYAQAFGSDNKPSMFVNPR